MTEEGDSEGVTEWVVLGVGSDWLFSTAVVRAALTSLRMSSRSDDDDGKSDAEEQRKEGEGGTSAGQTSALEKRHPLTPSLPSGFALTV